MRAGVTASGLLVVWIALLGADRVDLLAGQGPFQLTPFLVLSPLVLATELPRIVRSERSFPIPPRISSFGLTGSCLLGLLMASTLASYDQELSFWRVMLLLVQVGLVMLIAVVLANQAEPHRVLVRGAIAGLGVCLAFNAIQTVVWLRGGLGSDGQRLVDLMPGNYYGIIPRLTGAAGDPNRGGLLILIYLFLVLRWGGSFRGRSALAWLGSLSLLLTLSRSVMLATAAVLAGVLLQRLNGRTARAGPWPLLGGSLAAAMVVVVLLLVPPALESVLGVADVLANRFSLQEGSSSEHLAVMQRGLDVATSSVRHALLGVGYGNAYSVLQEFYPGNKYGNFHSLYVTLFAEAGIFALIAGLVLIGYPLVRGGALAPLVGGFVLFNLFYQSHTEPAFWFILLLAWSDMALPPRDGQPGSEGERAPQQPLPRQAVLAGGGHGR